MKCIAGVARAIRRNGPDVVASIRARATAFTSYSFLARTIRGDRHIAYTDVSRVFTSKTCRDPMGHGSTRSGNVDLLANGVRNKYHFVLGLARNASRLVIASAAANSIVGTTCINEARGRNEH